MNTKTEALIVSDAINALASRLNWSLKSFAQMAAEGHFTVADAQVAGSLERSADRLREMADRLDAQRNALLSNAPRRVRVA